MICYPLSSGPSPSPKQEGAFGREMRRPGHHHTKGKELLACSQARHYLNAPFWWLSQEGSLGQDPGGAGHEVGRLPPLPGQLPASLLSAPQGLGISLAGFLMKQQGEKKPMAASWGLLYQVPPSSSSEGQDAESGVNAELRPTIPTIGNLVHLSNRRKQEAPGPPPARAHTGFLVLSRPTHPPFRWRCHLPSHPLVPNYRSQTRGARSSRALTQRGCWLSDPREGNE